MNLFIICDLYALLIKLLRIFKSLIKGLLSSYVMLIISLLKHRNVHMLYKTSLLILKFKGICCAFGKKPAWTILELSLPFAYVKSVYSTYVIPYVAHLIRYPHAQFWNSTEFPLRMLRDF